MTESWDCYRTFYAVLELGSLSAAARELGRVVPSVALALPCCIAMHENLKASLRCRAVFDALVAGLQAYIA